MDNYKRNSNSTYNLLVLSAIIAGGIAYLTPSLIDSDLSHQTKKVFLYYSTPTLLFLGLLLFTNKFKNNYQIFGPFCIIAIIGLSDFFIIYKNDQLSGILLGYNCSFHIIIPFCFANLKFKPAFICASIQLIVIGSAILLTYGLHSYITKITSFMIIVSFIAGTGICYLINRLIDDLNLEKEKSSNLLRAIFPKRYIKRLENSNEKIIENIDHSAVIFADLVGFTKWSSQINPKKMIEHLELIYSKFEAIGQKYKAEKVKTIGDCYMGYINDTGQFHNFCDNAISFGLELHKEIEAISKELGADIKLKVGIATGKVLCGIIGSERPQFDIWGQTVNLAARLEQNGSQDQILVCENTYKNTDRKEKLPKETTLELKGLGATKVFVGTHT